jgi:hypothetical protein
MREAGLRSAAARKTGDGGKMAFLFHTLDLDSAAL